MDKVITTRSNVLAAILYMLGVTFSAIVLFLAMQPNVSSAETSAVAPVVSSQTELGNQSLVVTGSVGQAVGGQSNTSREGKMDTLMLTLFTVIGLGLLGVAVGMNSNRPKPILLPIRTRFTGYRRKVQPNDFPATHR